MGLLLDPREPVPLLVEDVTFLIRVFTSREKARFFRLSAPLQDLLKEGVEEGGKVTAVIEGESLRMLEQVLCLGVAGWSAGDFPADKDGYMSPATLDRIPVPAWNRIYQAIVETNTVTEEDLGNSQSPSQ